MKCLSNEEINLLRLNARSVVRELGLLNDAYFGIGVTLAERHFLIELSTCLYPTVGEIAERLLLDKSTASRLIAKAVKKGYVKCSSDKSDKRKRFLQLTEKGKKTLNAFEPIAFNQTKEALLTLIPDEINIVYHGVALYAKGLKNSRLRSKVVIRRMTLHDYAGLAQLPASLDKREIAGIRKEAECVNLFETFQKQGHSYFVMKMDSKIIGGAGIFPFKGTHGCEIGKIFIQPEMQHLGLEKLLIDFCLKEAKKAGYDKCYIDHTNEGLLSVDFLKAQGFQSVKKSKQDIGLLWKAC